MESIMQRSVDYSESFQLDKYSKLLATDSTIYFFLIFQINERRNIATVFQ